MRPVSTNMDGHTEDTQDVTRARAGDRTAFTGLFERHYRPTLQYARAITRSSADAEDLTADALLRMFSALRAGRGPIDNVPAYLRTTVRRLCSDLGVRTARTLHVGLGVEAADGIEGQDVDELAPSMRYESPLAAAFQSLTPRWREVLWMVEVLGYRPYDVAKILNIEPAAACSLLWRARKALRERFDQVSAPVPRRG